METNALDASLLARLDRVLEGLILLPLQTSQPNQTMSSGTVPVRPMGLKKIIASEDLSYDVYMVEQWLDYTREGGSLSYEVWKAWKEEEEAAGLC